MAFDAAVVVTTVCRPSLLRAVRSVYAQDYSGTIQVLVGVDVDPGAASDALYAQLERECPRHVVLTWMNLGYSTSRRHGGVHACGYGGSLRSALSFCANARHVAYLDDDDWYEPTHLRRLRAAIEGRHWAYTLCWYADPDSGRAICEDGLESLGPGLGCYAQRYGGFVRPSALMIDKLALPEVLHLWSLSPYPGGDGEDRLVFEALRHDASHASTGEHTVYYALDPRDANAALRAQYMRSRGITPPPVSKPDSTRALPAPAAQA